MVSRHPNLKERPITDFTQKVCICKRNTEEEFDPKRADKYYKCAYKSTKVDGKCMFDKKCKTEVIIYNAQWIPTGHTYIGESQGKNKPAY